MAAVTELIRAEADGSLSFGNHLLQAKGKKEGFESGGDQYKVKTFREMTKLERNGMFVYESVPGTSVEHFVEDGVQCRSKRRTGRKGAHQSGRQAQRQRGACRFRGSEG